MVMILSMIYKDVFVRVVSISHYVTLRYDKV